MAIAKYKQIKLKSSSAKLKSTKVRINPKKSTKRINPRSKKLAKRSIKTAVPAVTKQPSLPLNLDFYNTIDGVYTSY